MQHFLLADDNSDLRSALRLILETRLKSPLVFEAAQAALNAHADAFICKTDPPSEILHAIHRLNGKD
jgi:hypothetical protein